MADGMKQNHWALGSVNRRRVGDNLFIGQSSFDGSDLYVKLVSYPELQLVDYYIGHDRDHLQPLVEARIKPGEVLGVDPGSCVVTLTIWRSTDDRDEDWAFHHHLWETEVRLIKGAIERGL
jgi:hypothetical protein